MSTLKVSLGIGNHLLCVRYTKFGADIHIVVQRTNRAPFMIVHHIKNVVSVSISMMSLFLLLHQTIKLRGTRVFCGPVSDSKQT